MIIDQVRQQLTESLKQQEAAEVGTFRMLISALEYKRMQKNAPLSEDEEIAVVKSEVKKRQEAIEIYRQHGESERLKTESAELEILEKFLPAQASENEIRAVIKQLKSEFPDTDKGQLIGKIIAKFGKGTVDGSLVARLVNEN